MNEQEQGTAKTVTVPFYVPSEEAAFLFQSDTVKFMRQVVMLELLPVPIWFGEGLAWMISSGPSGN